MFNNYNCMFVCVYVHTHRMDKNAQQRFNATGAALVDSNLKHQVIEDDDAYSTVDDMQQQKIVAIDNPAYSKGLEHSQRPAQQHNHHGRSTIELSQEQEMVTCGPQAHDDAQLKEASSTK